MVLEWIIGSTVAVSLISLVGIIITKNIVEKYLSFLISFAAGTLLAVSFFDLIPEAMESGGSAAPLFILGGFVVFFALERVLSWHSHAMEKKEMHSFAYLNMLGDGIHNFLDGVIIASSYLVSIPLGIATTVAVIFHEIPQEISDYGILVYGGLHKGQALKYNLLTALTSVAGALTAFYAIGSIESALPVLLGIAAGGFVYITASDLIPELQHEKDKKKSIMQFILVVFGIAVMYGFGIILGS